MAQGKAEPLPAAGEVRAYLESMTAMRRRSGTPLTEPYSCLEEFVLRNGRAFRPGPTPRGVRRGEPRQCFMNASAVAEFRAGDGWLYVEGFAAGVLPVHHAWLCRPEDDLAIEVTWPAKLRQGYFGVPFRLEFVMRTQQTKCTSVLDQWPDRWPLLRGAVPESEWKPAPEPPTTGWRYFPFMRIREAKLWARAGGVAVHDTGMEYKGKWACHLFARNTERLRAAARAVGCQLKWIQYSGTPREHYDLFAGPLQKALARCPNRPAGEPDRE